MAITGPGTEFVSRRVVVVDGPLAFRMRRVRAARDGDLGQEILTIPQLAARLAGGFSRPADEELLYPAISRALAQDGLTELAPVATLPGMVRAVTQTLRRVWSVDINLDAAADQSPRFRDLALIEARVRATLPARCSHSGRPSGRRDRSSRACKGSVRQRACRRLERYRSCVAATVYQAEPRGECLLACCGFGRPRLVQRYGGRHPRNTSKSADRRDSSGSPR
jgi:hypothetical protein